MKKSSYCSTLIVDPFSDAGRIYQSMAEDPIFDFHTHFDPGDIACNRSFESATQLFIRDGRKGDHYVWALMRAAGVPEDLITGPLSPDDASQFRVFKAFAESFPLMRGNPVYVWTRMALDRFFQISEELNETNARDVYETIGTRLRGGMSVHDILSESKVAVVCTTDDPCDSLTHHRSFRSRGQLPFRMLPTWRPDRAMEIEKETFPDFVRQLSEASDMDIETFNDFCEALGKRHDFFHENSCRTADHGIFNFFPMHGKPEDIEGIFEESMRGRRPDAAGAGIWKGFMLQLLLSMNAEKGWAQQLHVSPMRNVNTSVYSSFGPDAGCDTVGPAVNIELMSNLLDALHSSGKLSRTIVYTLNRSDFERVAALLGRFQGGEPGRLQLGVPWWFNDHAEGMNYYFDTVRNAGLLSLIPGMLSDSRSFISASVRFDYFRRTLAAYLDRMREIGYFGGDPEASMKIALDMAGRIASRNARAFFRF